MGNDMEHLRSLEELVTDAECEVNRIKGELKEAKAEFDAAVAVLREAIRQTKEPTLFDAQQEVIAESHTVPVIELDVAQIPTNTPEQTEA